MYLYNMQNIRQSKRISRKTLADYLKVPVELIKDLETKEFEEVCNKYKKLNIIDLIDDITDYLDVLRGDLVLPDFDEDQLNRNVRKIYETFKIPVSKDISDERMRDVFIMTMRNNNDVLGPDNLDRFVAELKYRIGDTEDNNTDFKPRSETLQKLIKDLEFDLDDTMSSNIFGPFYDKAKLLGNNISFFVDDDLGFDKEHIDNIRREARTMATIYKELVANKLPHEICIDILKATIDSAFKE